MLSQRRHHRHIHRPSRRTSRPSHRRPTTLRIRNATRQTSSCPRSPSSHARLKSSGSASSTPRAKLIRRRSISRTGAAGSRSGPQNSPPGIDPGWSATRLSGSPMRCWQSTKWTTAPHAGKQSWRSCLMAKLFDGEAVWPCSPGDRACELEPTSTARPRALRSWPSLTPRLSGLAQPASRRSSVLAARREAKSKEEALEGRTHLDALLLSQTSGFALHVEAKVLAEIDTHTTYDSLRNQLARDMTVWQCRPTVRPGELQGRPRHRRRILPFDREPVPTITRFISSHSHKEPKYVRP
jgi:hypothetical protein